MPGWSSAELLPLLRKCETCHYVDGGTHGTDGPVNVSFGGFTEERVVADASEAVTEMGYEVVPDANNLVTGNAFQVCIPPRVFGLRLMAGRGGRSILTPSRESGKTQPTAMSTPCWKRASEPSTSSATQP